ncbi:MAG: 4-alpha-glucanotransferase [Alphaproteobacteria bacterium]|nr:4-alpha-glucanotransferase [Alphaproteobacteria bacterium]
MSYNTDALNDLSYKLGIWLEFTDYGTNTTYIADVKSKKALCKALGYPADTNEQVQVSLDKYKQESFLNFAPFTRVIQEWELKPFNLEFIVEESMQNAVLSWVLTREDGTGSSGQLNVSETDLLDAMLIGKKTYQKRRCQFVLEAPIGYHNLSFLLDGQKLDTNYQTKLIVVPQTCYMPEKLQSGHRVWGFPIQLYAMKSNRNWGIGDFTDLKNFAPIAEKLGASLVGINPVNALFADNPEDASPYCATSRVFLNPLYIDTDAVPEAQDNPAYTEYKNSVEFTELFKQSNTSQTVLYKQVAEMKFRALDILYKTFKTVHLDKDGHALTARGSAFKDFCHNMGEKLTNYAIFQAVRDVRTKNGKGADCWWNWGKGFETPKSPKAQEFKNEYADLIYAIKYQQFLAFEQYREAGDMCKECGLSVGLYTDLPVGVGANSSEVWSNQTLFLKDVSVGAPPDSFNKKGQDWSLSGFNPYELKKSGYDLYIRTIAAAMKNAGAVRIDHAFGLSRLFYRVKGGSGAYLAYPFKDFMGIVALESVRHQCLVIAEDLGTAPAGFHELMRGANVLSFGIFHWQKNWDGFIAPQDYNHKCLISSGTHDLPTYTALWKGLDLELAKKMKTISAEQYKMHKENRKIERTQFVKAFLSQSLPMDDRGETEEIMAGRIVPNWFIPNSYAYLARSSSMLLLVRIEDIVEQEEQVNLPGTYLEYPNWRYKLPVALEELKNDTRMIQICEIINKERPK